MSSVLAFDVYGTLINTHGLVGPLETLGGDSARQFSQTWRDKQLEYAFRKGLMQNYQSFAVCTRQALDYTCAFYGAEVSEAEKQELLQSYGSLPAFEDVAQGLSNLSAAGHRLFAFSNGSADAVEGLLQHAGIRRYFEAVVSCDDLKSFKPNPAVYAHFLRQAKSPASKAWLVSSNPFDVIGSISAGMRAAWVKRSPEAVFDPWDIQPTVVVGNLQELQSAI